MQHFSFECYRAEMDAQNLTAMIIFCYPGSNSLPSLLEYHDASAQVQQPYSLLHLYIHVLGRQYGIASLKEHSVAKMKAKADTLREMHSRVYLAESQCLSDYSGFKKGDPVISLAFEQLQLTIRDMEAERIASE